MSVKNRVYEIITSPENPSIASKVFDVAIIVLIVINVITSIADTFAKPQWLSTILWYIELVSVIIFTVEYLLRIYVADLLYPELPHIRAKLRYMRSPMAVIDLLAILPFYIPYILPIDLRVLRILRIFRMLRIFKLNRYTNALSTIGDIFKRKKHQLISSISVVLVLMVIAAILMYHVESEAQPDNFNNALTALWWTVETLTTVGYGDVVPVTAIGKLLSTVISLLGIGLVAVPTGIISAGFAENLDEQKHREEEKIYCPYCGKKLK